MVCVVVGGGGGLDGWQQQGWIYKQQQQKRNLCTTWVGMRGDLATADSLLYNTLNNYLGLSTWYCRDIGEVDVDGVGTVDL